MNTEQGIWLASEVWQAVNERAQSEGVTLEAWLERQIALSAAHVEVLNEQQLEDILLSLTTEHFKRLALEPDEGQALANAILATIVDGEPHRVGPIGTSKRHYVLRRRASAVTIQIGEGKVSLPLKNAAKLAVVLDNTRKLSSALAKLAA